LAPTLANFIQDIPLLTDKDTEDKKEDNNKVTLMTIHASKGLEYPHVYVTGLEENLFPSQMSIGSRKELEEERRLFYVAITRAEKSLTISFAKMRYKWGDLITTSPSRFLNEIDPQYLDITDHGVFQRPERKENISYERREAAPPVRKPSGESFVPREAPRNLKKLSDAAAPATGSTPIQNNLTPGVKVQHQRFGIGTVLVVEGAFPNQKVTVDFIDSGKRQLLLKFAKLDVLN
jgi:DNA helicase-2/ATP-dependent DNA helicase PcrA